MNKRAFLVISSECTGTKIAAETFLKCLGCKGQVTDGYNNSLLNETNIMARWSVPTGDASVPGGWLNISEEIKKLKVAGFECTVVITVRDWYSILKSHERQDLLGAPGDGHLRTKEEIYDKVKKSYTFIFSQLQEMGCDYILFSYDTFIKNPKTFILNLGEILNLSVSNLNSLEVRDENKKYERAEK